MLSGNLVDIAKTELSKNYKISKELYPCEKIKIFCDKRQTKYFNKYEGISRDDGIDA
jgi:hypothetical protein